MDFKHLKILLELLLIKKNNFSIEKDEEELLIEIQFLLHKNNCREVDGLNKECKCELDENTIEDEIQKNRCVNCGLPLSYCSN